MSDVRRYVMSDPHFDHVGSLNWINKKTGRKVREFDRLDEMNMLIVENVNKTLRPHDKLYLLGDVSLTKTGLQFVEMMNCKKILIKGNHDIYELKDYIHLFEDIRSCIVIPKKVILTHIPIHTSELDRFKLNIHGHTHHENVLLSDGSEDKRYVNVCVEQIDYTPVDLETIIGEYKF